MERQPFVLRQRGRGGGGFGGRQRSGMFLYGAKWVSYVFLTGGSVAFQGLRFGSRRLACFGVLCPYCCFVHSLVFAGYIRPGSGVRSFHVSGGGELGGSVYVFCVLHLVRVGRFPQTSLCSLLVVFVAIRLYRVFLLYFVAF